MEVVGRLWMWHVGWQVVWGGGRWYVEVTGGLLGGRGGRWSVEVAGGL